MFCIVLCSVLFSHKWNSCWYNGVCTLEFMSSSCCVWTLWMTREHAAHEYQRNVFSEFLTWKELLQHMHSDINFFTVTRALSFELHFYFWSLNMFQCFSFINIYLQRKCGITDCWKYHKNLCCWCMNLKVIVASAVFLLLQYHIIVQSHFMQIYNMWLANTVI